MCPSDRCISPQGSHMSLFCKYPYTDHHSCLEEQVTVVGEEYSSGNHELEVEVFIAKLSAKWTNDITRDTCEELSFIMAWW